MAKNDTILRFDEVTFGYKETKPLLEEVDFSVRRGTKTTVMGQNGSGKSTLFKLILDLYEDYDGQILVGGIPLKKMKRQSFINHVAVVLQDTELFDIAAYF